jgi:hypothetical protein
MKRSASLALAVLSATAMLAACERGIVDPRAPAADGLPRTMESEDPSFENPRMLEPVDGEVGGGGGGDGGGGSGGGTDPFNPPPEPFYQQGYPSYHGSWDPSKLYSCGQATHAFWGLGSTWSNDITRGTTIYVSGIVIPGTFMYWVIYNQYGQRVVFHQTQPARSNCVVHHEDEAISTSNWAPGYYYVHTVYSGLENGGVESSFGHGKTYSKYVGPLRVR